MSGLPNKKICMLGEISVGKTSTVRRFVEGVFDERYLSTMGAQVKRKDLQTLNGNNLSFLVWDLAGGEEFTEHQISYLRGAAGALLVCDLTRPETFSFLEKAHNRLVQINPQASFVILGNKIDLIEDRTDATKKITEIAIKVNAEYVFSSAKTGEGIEEAFQLLGKQITST